MLLAALLLFAQATPPPNGHGPWMTRDDYPAEALRNHWDGTVYFSLQIDANGMPAGCTVTRSSGHKLLDDAACALVMRRARFKPKTDAKGKPVPGIWNSKLKWEIP